jgi:hypothetical protein
MALPLVRDREPGVADFVTANSAATPDIDTNTSTSGNNFFFMSDILISCYSFIQAEEVR